MPDNKQVTWPGWEVVRVIGNGSFGSVYEIQRNTFGNIESAALKVISIPQSKSDIEELYNDGYDDASITARFNSYLEDIVKEYSLMVEMKGHTNVVYCDDFRYVQHDDGIGWDIYIKMELLTALTKVLGKEISEEQTIKLGIDICNALVLCKSRNIVHRDIKPQNIFVSKDGNYKLGDFGIAKTAERTTSGTKVGTYKYMAPEVYNNQPYGAGADIYSLGLVLYWMLNERRTPFLPLPPQVPTTSLEDEARRRRFSGEPLPEPVHGSAELKRIVLKACAYDPKERYAAAADMLADLRALQKGVVTPVSPIAAEALAGVAAAGTVAAAEEPTEKIKAEDTEGTVNIFASRAAKQQAEDEPTEYIREDKTEYIPRQTAAQPQPLEENKPKKKSVGKWIAIAAGIVAVIVLILLLLHSCGGNPTPQDETTEPVGTTEAAGTTDGTNPNDITEPGQTVPEKAVMIKVVGMYENDAVSLLERQSFVVEVNEDYSDSVAAGLVIAQNPEPETELDAGSSVTITVSLGKKVIIHSVPDVTGKTESEARSILDKLNFVVEAHYSKDDTVPEGSVITQNVTAGTELAEGSTIQIGVSSGKPTVQVVNVVGKSKADAEAVLKQQGFSVKITEEYSLTVAAGKVISQSPQAGSSQIMGSTITLCVSKGKQAVQVTLDANGGSVSSSSLTVYNGAAYGTLPTPTRTGYTFNGWFTAKSGGTAVTASTVVSNASAHTLYAQWTANKYTVTFNANGGSASATNKTVTYGSPYGALPTATRDYYNFTGWYTASSGGTKVTSASAVSISSAQTLYAHWELKPLSNWVLASSAPSDAQIVNRKWTYTKTETQESTSSSISGWTQTGSYWNQTGTGSVKYASFPSGFDTSHWIYTSFAKSAYTASDNGSTKRVVSNKWAGYVYWHWMYSCSNANGTSQRAIYNKYGYGPDNSFLYKYFGAFTSTNGNYSSDKYYCNSLSITNYIIPERTAYADCQGSTRWFRFDYYTSTYTDYQKVYQYQKVTTGLESTTEVTASSTISDVKAYVQYREK